MQIIHLPSRVIRGIEQENITIKSFYIKSVKSNISEDLTFVVVHTHVHVPVVGRLFIKVYKQEKQKERLTLVLTHKPHGKSQMCHNKQVVQLFIAMLWSSNKSGEAARRMRSSWHKMFLQRFKEISQIFQLV